MEGRDRGGKERRQGETPVKEMEERGKVIQGGDRDGRKVEEEEEKGNGGVSG